MLDAVALTQSLVRLDTAGPAPREAAAADLLAPLLAAAGFAVDAYEMEPGRPSLVARYSGDGGPPLVLTGHLDTVPVGAAPWRRDPFSGALADGRIHGRGSTDMKAGVAAVVAAAVAHAEAAGRRPVALVLTAGEETGCLGAAHLRDRGALPRASGVVVAEPTGNRIGIGHRGALWLEAAYAGVGAHGSMPHLGRNAIYAAAAGIDLCRTLAFDDMRDALLGAVTLNVGTVRGGINVNSVPDRAAFTLDLRSTLPGSHTDLVRRVGARLGSAATLSILLDLPAVRTDPGSALVLACTAAAAAAGVRDLAPRALPFFTDASVLGGACGADVVIVGPGDPALAHQTDESCALDEITAAVALYRHLLAG